MPELTETVEVDAPAERVWAALTDWSSQGAWMLGTDVRTVLPTQVHASESNVRYLQAKVSHTAHTIDLALAV